MPFKIKAKQLDGDVGSGMYTPEVAPDAESTELGGAPSRTANTWSTYTISQVLDQLLFKYQSPGMGLSITVGGASVAGRREVGNNLSAGADVTIAIGWNTTDPEINAQPNQVIVSDPFGTVATAQPIDGSISRTYSNASLTPAGVGTRTWSASGTNTKGAAYSGSAGITWSWRWYWGNSPAEIPNESLVKNLANDPLEPARPPQFVFPAAAGGTYKYWAFQEDMPLPANFILGGNNLPMAFTAPFTNGTGSVKYAEVTVTNDFNRTTKYRVFRSLNPFAGVLTVSLA